MSDDHIEIKKAVEGVNTAFAEYKTANDERLKQIEAKGAVDPVTEEKLAKIDADMARMQEITDKAVLDIKKASRVITDENGQVVDMEAKAAQFSRSVAAALDQKGFKSDASALEIYNGALAGYMRKGMDALSEIERKALSVGGDPQGGYVVNPDMSGQVVTQVFETSPMRAYASIQAISTNSLEGLFDLNEADAGWVGETGARTETNTPNLGKWSIPVHELYANPRATQKILDDAEINMESWLAAKVADKFARTEAVAFITGDGVEKPRGFLDYTDGTTLPGTIEQFDTGVNGAFAAAPNGGNVLIDALYGLKAQYRANATWFMNRGTTKLVREMRDSDGAYLWSPGIAAGQPASLMGYPIAAFEDMPDPATGSLSLAVGDMRAAYQIVDRIGIRTLRDPFSAKPYVQFYTTKRVGGDVVNFEAIKLINFKA